VLILCVGEIVLIYDGDAIVTKLHVRVLRVNLVSVLGVWFILYNRKPKFSNYI